MAKTSASSDRLSDVQFSDLIVAIRRDGARVERSIQRGFTSAWRDLAASHSTDRLTLLWQVLAETKSPYKTQVSLAIRALAGMATPVKSAQKWKRTGKEPLAYTNGSGWTLTLDDEAKRELATRLEWGEIHFRSIQVAAATSVFTWAEASAFAERIRKAGNRGTIPTKDIEKLSELLNEIERIAAK